MTEAIANTPTKDELIDIANVTLVRFMYYANRERIPLICSKLGLPENVVMKYLDMKVPKDEKLDHVIEYINAKTFDQLSPMETLLSTFFTEITEATENPVLRSKLVGNYVAISKNYALYLDMLRRVNSMNEAGNSIQFNFNIVDAHNMIPR